ncbi:MAG: KpsF/GutQ family sugar-phosphate isomerase [Archangium sp.]|nr:KpsF/GutQ family sugar-phosphate isomerase [Archangium sp.]MDP3154053.1 KpsF/GutQ family sugar-phosphate isomerase [Archangium sp.]MDP3570044.1 KpsF/GutQ family sugar-phosphate isomerase [Archangium sp.]
MARPRRSTADRSSPKASLAYARTVLDQEASAIASLGQRIGHDFLLALDALERTKGRVVCTGMGKPGFIAQKLSATLSSTGIPSFYLHPAEAAHGDLGRVAKGDVVVALSNSGTTEEVLRLLIPLKRLGVTVIALTADVNSPLGRGADLVVSLGDIDEACPMGLVPTASSAALHAICDALAMTLAWRREFTESQYALYHPGGKLGRSVMKVREVMRTGDSNPLIRDNAKLKQVIVVMTQTRGRPGAANVVDAKGRLVGIFTDGDLRRLAERDELELNRPISEVMIRRPRCIGPEELVFAAAAVMRETKIDQLPVIDAEGRAVGLLDVQDVLAARLS